MKSSNKTSEKLLSNSFQMYNLLKILNKGKFLEGLNSIDEVYDGQVNVFDEIVFFHQNRHTLIKPDEESKVVSNVRNSSRLINNTVLINDEGENQGILENYINKDEPVEREVKSTLFGGRKLEINTDHKDD